MYLPGNHKRVLSCLILSIALLGGSPVWAGDASDALKQAVRLYEQGEYAGAQHLLAGIDRDDLSGRQRKERDNYLNKVQVALTMQDKGRRDLEDAQTAMRDGDNKTARMLLESVAVNEYAPPSVKDRAEDLLGNLQTDSNRSTMGLQARRDGGSGTGTMTMTPANGGTARQAAPQPARRTNRATAPAQGQPDSGSLAGEVRRLDAINWQRTVTTYRDLEQQIRELISDNEFEEAGQLLIRARQAVESGKQFADPVVQYENLMTELAALERTVESEERVYNEQRSAETRREIERDHADRLREVEERRAEQIDQLMLQATQLRKDGDIRGAINVLKQVTAIDPKYQPAHWLMDDYEGQMQLRRQVDMRDRMRKRRQEAIIDAEEAAIPWWETLTYPDDWIERINRPERQRPGEAVRDSQLHSALDAPIEVDFRTVPFDQVIQRLADARKINLNVHWHDLAQAGVERDVPIDLQLHNEISLRKALTEVLAQAGGGQVDLDFAVQDGLISVATKKTLDQRVFTAVYPIEDLLLGVPSFEDPQVRDLQRMNQPRGQRAESKNKQVWRYEGEEDLEPEEDPERESMIQHLISVIQSTVEPDSWRNRGGSIGTIEEINGQLVVTQNTAAQQQIGGLLDKLREQRAIQIAVEAIFLTVSSHYLEELGLDLDIVLNAGNAGFDLINEGGASARDPVLGSNVLLPRQFSRLGFTPATPALGTALNADGADAQPFRQPFLVPQRSGGSGSQFTPIPITNNVTDFTDPSRLPSDIPGSFAGNDIGPALSILGSFLDNIQVDFLIRATQADSRTSVLTAPRVVVFNGGSAWVAVTIQQNFVSQLNPVVAQGAAAQAPVTGTIDAGASLFVRATVTADRRYVLMLLAPGITRLLDLQNFAFSGGTLAGQAFIQLPTLSSQRLQTMVSVPDGGTLLIGGQKLANEAEIEAGVPILSKIPVLKRAYSSRSMVKDEQTLLILIKPKILIHSEQEEQAFPSFANG